MSKRLFSSSPLLAVIVALYTLSTGESLAGGDMTVANEKPPATQTPLPEPLDANSTENTDTSSGTIDQEDTSPHQDNAEESQQTLAQHQNALDQSALLPYKLTYKATYNGIPITATRELSKDQQGGYLLKSRAKNWLGKIEESAAFKLDDNKAIVNDYYIYKRSIFGRKKTEQLNFDYQQNTAVYKTKKHQQTIELSQQFHSRFSYQTQLRRDLIAGKTEFVYPTIARGKIKDYRFEIIGEEQLETALGTVRTVKLKRIRENSKRETLLWFAIDVNYILVKLWQREKDGEDYQITLKEGSLGGVPLEQLDQSQ